MARSCPLRSPVWQTGGSSVSLWIHPIVLTCLGPKTKAWVGVDLGVSALSTREPPVPGPKPHKVLLGRLRRLSRKLSRKQKGSANRRKEKEKLAKLHARIANIRQDALHKLTTDLTRRFHTIGIEDLNLCGVMKNRHLARSLSNMGFFEFRRQLEYKAARRGGQVVVAPRFFASSKMCSACQHKLDELGLSVREWTCAACAALNMFRYIRVGMTERLK
jgi:putative transposase